MLRGDNVNTWKGRDLILIEGLINLAIVAIPASQAGRQRVPRADAAPAGKLPINGALDRAKTAVNS